MTTTLNKLSLHLKSEISLKDFSFSQLILAVKQLFDTEGIPGLIKVLVILIENLLIKNGVKCPRCQGEKHHFHSKNDRKIKTTIGEVCLTLSRLSCLECKKTFCPFNSLLDLNKYSRKSRELEKLTLETVTNQSFRRSQKHLNDTLGFNTPHTTLHRWFTNTDSTDFNVTRKVDFLVADGTGFKREKADEFDTNRGEVRIVIGYNKSGEVIPFGAWTRASWKDIGKFIKSKNHPTDKIKLVKRGQARIVGNIKVIYQLKEQARALG